MDRLTRLPRKHIKGALKYNELAPAVQQLILECVDDAVDITNDMLVDATTFNDFCRYGDPGAVHVRAIEALSSALDPLNCGLANLSDEILGAVTEVVWTRVRLQMNC